MMGVQTVLTAALLVVRVYHGIDVVKSDVQTALGEATGIMTRAGVEVAWVDCAAAVPDGPVDTACAQPLAPREVVVRVLARGPKASGRFLALGYTPVVDRAHRDDPGAVPVLATVYADRVARVADAAEVDPPAVMGRAIAHELGHLLLNRADHAHAGLMRAVWSRDHLRSGDPSAWAFVDADAEAMRAAIGARAAAAHS